MKSIQIEFENDLLWALERQSAAADTSVSELVNEAVKAALIEDAWDLAAFKERRDEPSFDFNDCVARLGDS
ncbi:MAG: CopG family transcriptional regulator [Verrucomicrobiota bacterium]